jgi:anti-anti-sigma regulatory factor
MTSITAQDFFGAEELPADGELSGAELRDAFWQLKKMQRESRQQQTFWKSVNDSMSDAYAKLGSFQEELKASRAELSEANARLEEKVGERTAALRAQLDQIKTQQETIRALVTPVIHVWERVLVLPIIGALDPGRAAEITEDLLRAVAESSSAFVVLDLTGVTTTDAETADHLLRISRAVRLLGARCLLSGLSGAVAKSFTTLDIDLGQLVSFGTLQAALHHALVQMGELPGAPPRASRPHARG